MKKYLLAAGLFALQCYAAEHSHAWTVVKGQGADQMLANSYGPGETITFTTPQSSFNIYWENARPNDVLTFNDFPTTFYGGTVESVLGRASGDLSITSLVPFTQVRFIPNSPDPGAYFNPPFTGTFGPLVDAPVQGAAATPELSTMLMLTIGLALMVLPKLIEKRA